MGIARQALLWASRQPWLGEQFRKRAFAKRAISRFIPGEDVGTALNTSAAFAEEGITSLVTQLGENVTTPDEASEVTAHYIDVLRRITERKLPCHISLKPTQLGLDLGDELCSENLMRLVGLAEDSGSFIWVDMEGSAYVERTMQVLERARAEHECVGVCIQSYLFRAADDLERLIACKSAVRLVKGAYSEPADVAMSSKKDVDANFLMLARRMLEAAAAGDGGMPVFGTHDMQLLDAIIDSATLMGLEKRAYEIQMLYGIGREHQHKLAAGGHAMRVLISYGSAWFAWYMRRLAERPANVWFVARSVLKMQRSLKPRYTGVARSVVHPMADSDCQRDMLHDFSAVSAGQRTAVDAITQAHPYW